jgi:hypothetical protein
MSQSVKFIESLSALRSLINSLDYNATVYDA